MSISARVWWSRCVRHFAQRIGQAQGEQGVLQGGLALVLGQFSHGAQAEDMDGGPEGLPMGNACGPASGANKPFS